MSIPLVALALTVNVGGGTWSYGTTLVNVYSDYYHKSKVSHTTVYGLYNDSSGWQKAGTWAKASAVKNPFGGNQSFWKTR